MKLTIHVDGEIFSRQPHGGISRVFIELLTAWRRREDVETRLYLDPGLDAIAYRDRVDAIERLPSRQLRRGERYLGRFYDVLRKEATRRFWAKAKHGVFISTYYTSPPGVAIPRICILQDMIYERYPDAFSAPKCELHRKEKAACFSTMSGLITPSASTLSDAVRLYGKSGKPSCVIPYAAPPLFLQAGACPGATHTDLNHTGGRPYLLFMGGRGPHKNFDGLLRSFAEASLSDDLHLLAVGGGPTGPCESSLIDELRIWERVRFVNALSDEELVGVVKAAKAVVVPAFCEGYGFPVIEAMAAGRPVAASTGGSLPEVGRDVPVYFDPGDRAAMARALREAVAMQDDDPRLERGRAIARSRSWDDVAAEYVAFFHQVIDAAGFTQNVAAGIDGAQEYERKKYGA